jgi:hypothetical protein
MKTRGLRGHASLIGATRQHRDGKYVQQRGESDGEKRLKRPTPYPATLLLLLLLLLLLSEWPQLRAHLTRLT